MLSSKVLNADCLMEGDPDQSTLMGLVLKITHSHIWAVDAVSPVLCFCIKGKGFVEQMQACLCMNFSFSGFAQLVQPHICKTVCTQNSVLALRLTCGLLFEPHQTMDQVRLTGTGVNEARECGLLPMSWAGLLVFLVGKQVLAKDSTVPWKSRVTEKLVDFLLHGCFL